MKYTEIKELLDKGFTAEYIMNMELSENSDNEEQVKEPEAADAQPETPPEKPEDPAPFTEALNTFGAKMDELIKEMQASNILASRQPGEDKTMSAEDALAAIIMPPGNK